MAAPSNTKWGNIITGSKSTRKGKIGISVTQTSNTSTIYTVKVQVWFWSMYSISDTSNTYYYNSGSTSATTSRGSVSINHTVSTGDGWSTSNQTLLGETSYEYTKTKSTQTINYAAKLTGIDNLGSSNVTSVYTSANVPALASYKVTYNANGGSGAPSSQTKWYGTALTLSSTKPTRDGYTFKGWGTSSTTTTVSYAAGASYTANKAITLYAIWTPNTYKVTYNANGGSGAPSAQTKNHDTALTLSSTKPTRTNYTFKGWGTSKSATTVAYASGGTYTANKSITLYAIWATAYVAPTITSFTATRCVSATDKTASSTGTYINVKFSWTTFATKPTITIKWKKTSASSYSSTTVTASGTTSGTVNTVVGGGAISVDSTYTVLVVVNDATESTNKSKTVSSSAFPIDILAGGKGVAFGKAAEREGMDIGMTTYLRNSATIFGEDIDGTWHALMGHSTNHLNTHFAYGSWDHAKGTVYYNGNDVYLRSKTDVNIDSEGGKVYINGRAYGSNKVLWSGGYYMLESQTATLSEAISKQPNGIVLIFSAYRDGASQEYEFTSHFIPKWYVSTLAGKGMSFFMNSSRFGYIGTKYLYVSDTQITGNAANNEESTNSVTNMVYKNNAYVLRYVIGV